MTKEPIDHRIEKEQSINLVKGNLFILSAPSGAGKTTLCKEILKFFPDLKYSISHTTRKPRAGEQHGEDYFFLTPDKFKEKIATGQWAEWAEVHGHFYGTSAVFLTQQLADGHDILLDIDVNGTRQILEQFPDSVTIFILPPSMDELEKRLKKRDKDSEKTIAKRLRNARVEMAKRDIYQYNIVNDVLDDAIKELSDIIKNSRATK